MKQWELFPEKIEYYNLRVGVARRIKTVDDFLHWGKSHSCHLVALIFDLMEAAYTASPQQFLIEYGHPSLKTIFDHHQSSNSRAITVDIGLPVDQAFNPKLAMAFQRWLAGPEGTHLGTGSPRNTILRLLIELWN